MGSLYRLGQKFVDFCNVVQQNQNSEVTVPSSKVLYDALSPLSDLMTNNDYRIVARSGTGSIQFANISTYSSFIMSVGCSGKGSGIYAIYITGGTVSLNKVSGIDNLFTAAFSNGTLTLTTTASPTYAISAIGIGALVH